jgi:large subunit ribosomal protein L29
LFNLRFQQAMGQIENPMRLRTLRKDVAKTKTILREKHGRV